jgi:hypothetical protein
MSAKHWEQAADINRFAGIDVVKPDLFQLDLTRTAARLLEHRLCA